MLRSDELAKSIQSGKCVAFIGSGLSADSYGPNGHWSGLVEGLCKHCGSTASVNADTPIDGLLDAAQSALDANKEAYYQHLGSVFGQPRSQANLLYDTLLLLPFKCYLTLNFDPLLSLKWRSLKVAAQDRLFAYPVFDRANMLGKALFHLHGYIAEGESPSEGTIVLARSEFETAYEANSYLMNLLIPTLTEDPVVFIGCGLRDQYMTRVFKICEERQQERIRVLRHQDRLKKSSPPPRFILLPKPDIRGPEDGVSLVDTDTVLSKPKEEYEKLGITPVWYSAPNGDHSELRLSLDQLAGLPKLAPNYEWGGSSIGP